MVTHLRSSPPQPNSQAQQGEVVGPPLQCVAPEHFCSRFGGSFSSVKTLKREKETVKCQTSQLF